MRSSRRVWLRVVGGFVLLGVLLWTADVAFDDPIEPGRIVHPGPHTTWLTGPLLPDGSVDYVAAVRDELARGVTPENNFTPVLSAMLASPIREAEEAPDFERPARLLEAWDEWIEHELPKGASDSSTEADDDTSYDANYTWIEGRFDGRWAPYVRRWLDEMSPTLDCIAREADRRERAFVPLTAPLLVMNGTSSVAIRRVMPIFLARALKRANEGDAKGCVDDFTMAVELLDRSEKNSESDYRISRHVGEFLLSRAVLLAATRFPSLDCAAFRRIHGHWPDATVDADLAAMVRNERLALLDFIVFTMRRPEAVASMANQADDFMVSIMRQLAGKSAAGEKDPVLPSPGRIADPPARSDAASAVAVDALLEELNGRFDRLASILSSPNEWSTRIDEVDKYFAEVERFRSRSKPLLLALVPGVRRLPWLRTEVRRFTADSTFSLNFAFIRKMVKIFVQQTAECDANRVRCAAACFKNEHHRPPRDLAELVAACFDAPPIDRVCGSPMQLTLRDDGEVEVTSAATPLAERLKAEREAERHDHGK